MNAPLPSPAQLVDPGYADLAPAKKKRRRPLRRLLRALGLRKKSPAKGKAAERCMSPLARITGAASSALTRLLSGEPKKPKPSAPRPRYPGLGTVDPADLLDACDVLPDRTGVVAAVVAFRSIYLNRLKAQPFNLREKIRSYYAAGRRLPLGVPPEDAEHPDPEPYADEAFDRKTAAEARGLVRREPIPHNDEVVLERYEDGRHGLTPTTPRPAAARPPRPRPAPVTDPSAPVPPLPAQLSTMAVCGALLPAPRRAASSLELHE